MASKTESPIEHPVHMSGQANTPLSLPPHALSGRAAMNELDADEYHGLRAAEAVVRLRDCGRNELDNRPGVLPFKILIHQIANAMILVLIIAMAVSFGIKAWIEGGVIATVIALNIVIGFFQEFKAEKTMDALRSLSSPTACVIRDGEVKILPTGELVHGDMIELKTGDTVPADTRLVDAVNFETDEALLTGESLPISKDAQEVFGVEANPGDRLNIAFSSSTVTNGRARGVVFATGMNTEIGSIAKALRTNGSPMRPVKHELDGSVKLRRYPEAWGLRASDFVGHFLGVNVGTPLQRKLSQLALLLFVIALVCAVIVMGANQFSYNSDVIIYAVATGLSMIPASLIVVLTITMAAGTSRMVDRHVIVRKLDSLEALGAVTDKTGTLTQGKMIVRTAWVPTDGCYSVGPSNEPFNPKSGELRFLPKPPIFFNHDDSAPLATSHQQLLDNSSHLKSFLNAASFANLAHVFQSEDGIWKTRGDPTEIAIQVFVSRFEWNRERFTQGEHCEWLQVAEFPFDSMTKRMSVIYVYKNQSEGEMKVVYSKGAVERILESCSFIRWGENLEPVKMTGDLHDMIINNVEALASEGLRILALASRNLLQGTGQQVGYVREEVEKDLTFEGLIGLYDPPRPESANAVKACQQAGISVHMLTGDHPGTARTIATQVGILPSAMPNIAKDVDSAMVMTAAQFDKLLDREIDTLPILPLVIARCSPITKVRMIQALHRRHCFVAMTGDGVNDSPSLKHADIGIAMGQSGSDVAKEASDIVLTDDNFASILNAIEEGRRIFDNIQKFVLHLLAENIAQACTLLIGLVFKDESGRSVFPLSPVEILWIIMITSGLPDMGLGIEVAAPNIMLRPPRNLARGVFTLEVIIDILVYGIIMSILCLLSFILVLYGFGDGNLGDNCNNSYSDACDLVFRARATTFVCLTWFALLLAWEMVNMRRSFFRMKPGSKRYVTQWMSDVWRNQFLFWAIMTGFVTIFPTLYIPVISHEVFKHEGISWEWGIVLVEGVVFIIGVETWKLAKRVYLRRRANHEWDGQGGNTFRRYDRGGEVK